MISKRTLDNHEAPHTNDPKIEYYFDTETYTGGD